MCRRVLCAAAIGLLTARSALAMEFEASPVDGDPNKSFILATGEIFAGDDAKLHAVVGRLPASATLVGIALSSPGGSYVEGVRLATSIRSSHIKTAVVPNAICASACFLMFAAGDTRLVFEGSRVGVHSASLNGEDNLLSEGVTTLMARQAKELGVPAAIIGKMVTTPPDEISWLTRDDLRSMNVVTLDSTTPGPASTSYVPGSALTPGSSAAPTPVSPPRPPPPAPVVASVPPAPEAAPYRYPSSIPQGYRPENAPVATIAPAVPAPSVSFMQGRSDRTTYQSWFDAQSGDIKMGAAWWSEHRSQAARQHLTCASMPGETPQAAQGCQEAQALLAQADARRMSDADYRSGWNSL